MSFIQDLLGHGCDEPSSHDREYELIRREQLAEVRLLLAEIAEPRAVSWPGSFHVSMGDHRSTAERRSTT